MAVDWSVLRGTGSQLPGIRAQQTAAASQQMLSRQQLSTQRAQLIASVLQERNRLRQEAEQAEQERQNRLAIQTQADVAAGKRTDATNTASLEATQLQTDAQRAINREANALEVTQQYGDPLVFAFKHRNLDFLTPEQRTLYDRYMKAARNDPIEAVRQALADGILDDAAALEYFGNVTTELSVLPEDPRPGQPTVQSTAQPTVQPAQQRPSNQLMGVPMGSPENPLPPQRVPVPQPEPTRELPLPNPAPVQTAPSPQTFDRVPAPSRVPLPAPAEPTLPEASSDQTSYDILQGNDAALSQAAIELLDDPQAAPEGISGALQAMAYTYQQPLTSPMMVNIIRRTAQRRNARMLPVAPGMYYIA